MRHQQASGELRGTRDKPVLIVYNIRRSRRESVLRNVVGIYAHEGRCIAGLLTVSSLSGSGAKRTSE